MCRVLDDPSGPERDGGFTFGSYAMPWLVQLATHDTIPKVGVAAMVVAATRINSAFGVLFWYLFVAWGADFLMGVAQAIADPETELRMDRARHGAMKLVAIFLIAVVAALMEGVTLEVIGWDPSGMLVAGACVAMFWEECVSIQRNGRHFYRSLRMRFGGLPWMGSGEQEDRDGA